MGFGTHVQQAFGEMTITDQLENGVMDIVRKTSDTYSDLVKLILNYVGEHGEIMVEADLSILEVKSMGIDAINKSETEQYEPIGESKECTTRELEPVQETPNVGEVSGVSSSTNCISDGTMLPTSEYQVMDKGVVVLSNAEMIGFGKDRPSLLNSSDQFTFTSLQKNTKGIEELWREYEEGKADVENPELLKGLSEILFLDPVSHEQLRQTGCYEFYHVDPGIVVANARYYEILSELRMNSKKLEAIIFYSSSLMSTYDKTSDKADVVSYSILEEIKELPVLVGNYLVRAEFLKDNFSIALNLIVSSDDSHVDIHSPRYLIQFSAHNIENEHLEKILMFADDAGIKELKMLPLFLKHACQYYGKLCFLFGDDIFLKGRDAPAIADAKFFANEKVLGRNLIAGDFSKILFDPCVIISSFSYITLEDKISLTGKWFADFHLVHVHGQTVCVCSSAEISKERSLSLDMPLSLLVYLLLKLLRRRKGEKLCSPFLF